MKRYLALDLGAESGRAVLGSFDGHTLGIEEIYRFPNEPVRTAGELHWDVLRLWHEVQRSIQKTASAGLTELDGLGLDTWGVDFALLGEGGRLLGNPFHYRDGRTDGAQEEVFRIVPASEIYEATGIQFMQINSLFQLWSAVQRTPKLVSIAEHFVTMPDLFHYWLSGKIANEYTNASTTQMLNPVTRDWARPLLTRLGLPVAMLGEVIPPGTVLGPLNETLRCGIRSATVIAPACHDTASAVAAVSMAPEAAFLSSGTWSLLGAEVPSPVLSPEARQLNFTNEGGVAGTTRLLKNIMGMWLLQECRREWSTGGFHYDYATLVTMASSEPLLTTIIDPDHPSFLHPERMTIAIADYCRSTGQPCPDAAAGFVQLILESLALKYRHVLESLSTLTGNRYREIRVIGGGARNRALNQFTADATGCRVVAGPVEATALGNLAMQMVATGAVGSIADARRIIDRSFPTECFEPQKPELWEQAYHRMKQLVEHSVVKGT